MNIRFTLVAVVLAAVFWLFESLLHYTVFNGTQLEFIPGDLNELWMRIAIILLIIAFGIFADYSSSRQLIKQRELEAGRIYGSMLQASHHILNNLLNQMQLFKIEAMKCSEFDPDIIDLYDAAIKEASELIDRLSKVEDINEGNIWASIEPKQRSDSSP